MSDQPHSQSVQSERLGAGKCSIILEWNLDDEHSRDYLKWPPTKSAVQNIGSGAVRIHRRPDILTRELEALAFSGTDAAPLLIRLSSYSQV